MQRHDAEFAICDELAIVLELVRREKSACNLGGKGARGVCKEDQM